MARRPLYEERSGWPLWVHGLLLLCFLAALLPLQGYLRGDNGTGPADLSPWVVLLSVLLAVGIPGFLYGLCGQLRVRVTGEAVEVAWGLSELIRKRIPFGKIQGMEAVTYSPLGEFGGWGIRGGFGKKVAWTVRGNRALLLHLNSGTHFYLGSQKPERLLLHIQSAGKGKMGAASETDEAVGG